MSRRRRCMLFLLLVAPLPSGSEVGAADAVFQYAGSVTSAQKQSQAFLWLPEAKQVRGVVMAGMTLAERELVKDPQIRKTCADEQLAIVFLKTGLASVDVQKVLDDLAGLSGCRELAVAPVFFAGHSAGGPQAKAAAVNIARAASACCNTAAAIPAATSRSRPACRR